MEIDRLTIFYNSRDSFHEEIIEMAQQTGHNIVPIPTSGSYLLWVRGKEDSIEGVYHGPTAIKRFLASQLEQTTA